MSFEHECWLTFSVNLSEKEEGEMRKVYAGRLPVDLLNQIRVFQRWGI